MPGVALSELLSARAAAILDGRLLLDATNAMAGAHLHKVAHQQALPQVRVYRGLQHSRLGELHHLGFALAGMQARADLLWCGPDGLDLRQVKQLISAVGLRPVRIGDLEAADLLDGVAWLWFALGLGQGRVRHLADD